MIETSSVPPRKSSVTFGKCSETFAKPLDQFWKIFGNLRKVVGNLRKVVKNIVIRKCLVCLEIWNLSLCEHSKINAISLRIHLLFYNNNNNNNDFIYTSVKAFVARS